MKTKKYEVTFTIEVQADRVPKSKETALERVAELVERIWDHEERADDPAGMIEDSYGFEAKYLGEGESDG